jgi:eukaryotic-like serine/threonine-protein kinase
MTDDTPSTPDDLDEGLAFAYGQDSQPHDSPSVIERIGEITGSKPSILLRDDRAHDTPMLKPLGPGESREAGKYVVHGELGRGGVGTVHRGHDQDLGRDVAMKFLHDKYKDEAQLLHRFVEEAQIGGQLQHPGIVPVYDLGMVDGKPFFAMKLVKGETLAKKLAERESPTDDRRTFLAIFEDVCQTMAYAHARGVVHRDLKPANIMIGSFGEVQVVDWGMGKVLGSGGVADEKLAAERQAALSVIETVRSGGYGSQSIVGSVMGTPAYMPPEQARGDVDAMDERSDVFALGAILCEILTGQPPYMGPREDLIAMAAMAKLDDAYARLAAGGGEPEMVELATRCLMPAPAARPRSAQIVAKAVHDHLAAAESRVHEARVEAAEAKVRAASLKRTQQLGIGLICVFAAGLAASLWFWRAADEAAANEKLARLAAVASAQEARDNEVLALEQSAIAERELTRALHIKSLISGMLLSVTPERAMGADTTLLEGILDTASMRLGEGAIEDEVVAAELHTLTGIVYDLLGLYPKAEQHLPVALEIRNRALGDEHPDTLSSMSYTAHLYEATQRYDEAESLYLQALETGERVLGEEHQVTLDSMYGLAGVFHSQGRLGEAELLSPRTLETQQRVLGEENARTLETMRGLASVYRDQGRLGEAESVLLRTLEIQNRVLGEEHPRTLSTVGLLAFVYQLQGRFAEAESLRLEELSISRRVLGEEHPNTLNCRSELANLYRDQGRYAEAERHFLELLEFERNVLGEAHSETLNTMSNLAMVYADQGHLDQAEALFAHVLEVRQRVLNDEHLEILLSMSNLSALYLKQGRLDEAEALLLETLRIQERVLGAENVHTLQTMGNLALTYQRQGRLDEAEALLLRSMEIQDRVLDPAHPVRLQTITNLASVYRGQDRDVEAESLYVEMLESQKHALGDEHADTLRSMKALTLFYGNQKRYDEAVTLSLPMLEIQRRVLGAEHRETLGTITNIGIYYYSLQRFEEAAAMFETSLPIKRRVLGLQHPYTRSALQGLANTYLALGRPEDALPLQRERLELQVASAEDEGASAAALNDAAWTLLTFENESLRDPERALSLAERACALEERAGSDTLWTSLDTLALAQHLTGDTAAAIATQQRAFELMPEGADPGMAGRLAEYEAAAEGR